MNDATDTPTPCPYFQGALRRLSAANRVASAAETAARQAIAEGEWCHLVAQVRSGEKNTHDAAMWLQSDGYRLGTALKEAHATWNALADESQARYVEALRRGEG